MTIMTGGDALAAQLIHEGVDQIFGLPGVQLDFAVDGLAKVQDRVKFLHVRHEQTTAYMADGYARSTGKVGVAMFVPGPGLFNAMAGLSTAWACSSPVLAICGQIQSNAIGKGYGLLHEVNGQSDTLATVTKWSAMARAPQEIPGLVREAFHQLRTGRPRPVGIEVPPDVLQAQADITLCDPVDEALHVVHPDAAEVKHAAELLRHAKRPVIWAGWGVQNANATGELTALAERLQAPVCTSNNGRGAIPSDHPLALDGLASRALFPLADVVIVVGSRFMGSAGVLSARAPDARFIYINADEHDFAAPRAVSAQLHADAKTALADLLAELDALAARPSAAPDCDKLRAWCHEQYAGVEPQYTLLKALRNAIPRDGILVNEMTQVGYVSRQTYPVYAPRTFITPGWQGTLGFGYPTALGVAAGNPDKAVVSINGDGGFGFGLAELATARQHDLNCVAVVFNDKAYGNVKRLQQQQFNRTLGSDLRNPDFVKVAEAFGVPAIRVHSADALEGALRSALAARGPHLIEIPVDEMPNPAHLMSESAKPPFPAPPNPLL